MNQSEQWMEEEREGWEEYWDKHYAHLVDPAAAHNIKSFLTTQLEAAEKRGILTKLKAIEDAKCIYNIHYCKAGVGVTFYDPKKDTGDWKSALTTNRYYPTFQECIEAEFASLTNHN